MLYKTLLLLSVNINFFITIQTLNKILPVLIVDQQQINFIKNPTDHIIRLGPIYFEILI